VGFGENWRTDFQSAKSGTLNCSKSEAGISDIAEFHHAPASAKKYPQNRSGPITKKWYILGICSKSAKSAKSAKFAKVANINF